MESSKDIENFIYMLKNSIRYLFIKMKTRQVQLLN